jgi:hypothetical protein
VLAVAVALLETLRLEVVVAVEVMALSTLYLLVL